MLKNYSFNWISFPLALAHRFDIILYICKLIISTEQNVKCDNCWILGLFPLAYVTCNYGVELIGYITMARGIADLITCLSLGLIGQKLPRNVWLSVSWFFICANTLALLLWEYIPQNVAFVMLVIISSLSGVSNSINMSQIPGKLLHIERWYVF